jgi:hypothetical protein
MWRADGAGGWRCGQTVSSDGRADFSDIAKIATSFNAEYAFINKAGKLVIPDYEKWTLPSSLEQGVVDAALGMQHGIALLKGGRAVVFGARYDGTVGDPAEPKQYGTPRWPLPEAHALEKVQAVAATVTHAATLHEDGTLSLWGWEGPLKWETDPRQKPLRQLRSTQDGFWALDEAGQLWHLPVPRNPAPGQPVYATDKPSLSESGVTHLGRRCWRRKSGEWIANMNINDGMDLMKAAGISESTAFSLDGGLFNGKPSASLLWIEPVTEGRAAGPPAAAVPPPTALGGPSALPLAKPGLTGRLRGAGFHLDGKPLDLKNAEGITDFVQVILTDRGWVGLRANGELVTPEAGLGEKNIARLLPSWFNSYGTIDREGRLSIQRPGSEGVKAVPEEVQRIGVVDACWDGDGGQAIALLKDGSVRVWGEHYTTGYKDTPVWPAPPTETLQNVRKIAITHWRAATLRQDGKWHIWGGHGGSSGPFDLQPFERWGEIADIETTYEPFRVLTRSGQVYNLGGSRPLTSGLVAEGIEAISDHLLLPKGSPVWTWNSNKSRGSAQAEVDALLQQIGNRPRGTFDLRIVGDHDASNVAALWIEPVEIGSAAGLPASVPSKPGRLEGTGTMANGKTLDLFKFDAYEDFLDVAGSSDFLVALRANGETVSSDGQADFQGIRRIARSFQGCHCFITETGELRFHPSREIPLPSSLKGRKVADAASGDQHAVALLEGGQAVVFGPRYEGAVNDMSKRDGLGTPRWPQPEAAALQKVKGVAVTYTHAATLHEDGTVSVWGWEGPVKWQPEAKMKPVRQISSFHDSLHLLDEAGQVWSLPLPRSAHPEQPVGFNGTVKPLGTAAVRLRDHLWLGTDGAWHGVAADRPVQELLERTDLQPETTFALLSSTTNAIPFSYVLWIEPVAPAGAAVSPSPSLKVSPSSPATLPPFTDREAAEWVLGLGQDACYVKVQMLKGGKFIEVRKLADLPAEPFVIAELRVNLSPKNQPEIWGQVTDAQVMRLAGLRSLKIVDLRGNVTGASLKVMAHHPGLESLQFEGLNLRADDLRHLRASRVQTLLLPMMHVADPESLAVLATMPNLRSLQLNENFDPALAAALPKLPKLEILRANTSAALTDEALPLLAERFPALTVLQHWGSQNLKGTTLGSLMALKSLTNLGLTASPVNDEGLAQIAGMPQLLTLDLGQTRITDACLPTLKSFPKLESLQIFQTELTDAALLELASIPTLKKLFVKMQVVTNWKPRVTFTDAGIAAFAKLRPDVEVVK